MVGSWANHDTPGVRNSISQKSKALRPLKHGSFLAEGAKVERMRSSDMHCAKSQTLTKCAKSVDIATRDMSFNHT